MIYTPTEYSQLFTVGKRKVTAKTIIRRCQKKMLPCNHKARKLPGKKGQWVIEVSEIVHT